MHALFQSKVSAAYVIHDGLTIVRGKDGLKTHCNILHYNSSMFLFGFTRKCGPSSSCAQWRHRHHFFFWGGATEGNQFFLGRGQLLRGGA